MYGTTRAYPLARDVESTLDPPSKVLWEQVLNSGDLLYIPRGWWHLAIPLDEPTLHLTVVVSNPTGADFLSWFVDRLRASEVVRQNIPHFRGPGAVQAYAEWLREALVSAWHSELIEEYMAQADANSTSRPYFALPWSATGDLFPPTGWQVQWSGNRPVQIETAGDQIAIAAHDRRWKFAAAARPLLELLISGRECIEDDLMCVACESLSSRVVRDFIRELAENGLVVAR